MAIDRIDEVVMPDTVEIWEIADDTASCHPFHVHDVQFQVLERNGEPPSGPIRALGTTHFVGWCPALVLGP